MTFTEARLTKVAARFAEKLTVMCMTCHMKIAKHLSQSNVQAAQIWFHQRTSYTEYAVIVLNNQ